MIAREGSPGYVAETRMSDQNSEMHIAMGVRSTPMAICISEQHKTLMLRLHSPLPTRYVDFGKVFVPNGALDFSTLAASDPDVARFGLQLFHRGLVFPETSPFAAQVGAISAALLMFEGGFLFSLVQRRREGELSTRESARTDLPFNQVRFI